MVTVDADQYSMVEVYGARNAAVIRERIFTKVSDRAALMESLVLSISL